MSLGDKGKRTNQVPSKCPVCRLFLDIEQGDTGTQCIAQAGPELLLTRPGIGLSNGQS